MTPAPPVLYRDHSDGVLGVAKLNPAAPPSVTSFALQPVVDEILAILGKKPLPRPPEAHRPASEGEAAEGYAAEVSQWILSWGKQHPAQVATVANRIAASIGAPRWNAVDEDVQIMIATADFIGYNLSGGDFSGPVIGLCAAIEHIVHSHVIEPALTTAPPTQRTNWRGQVKTFGAALAALEAATGASPAPLNHHVRQYLISAGRDIAQISSLLPEWRELNKKYRIPAAHRQLVSQESWQDAYVTDNPASTNPSTGRVTGPTVSAHSPTPPPLR